VDWTGLDWTGLAQDRDRWRALVIAVMNLRVPQNAAIVGGKARGKEATRKTRRRWVDTIRTDLVEVGWGDVNWIRLAQDRDKWRALVNAVMNLRVA
jgi:hypothetical protein